MRYQRVFTPGGTYFFTLVTYHRQKLFVDENSISLLRESFRYVIGRHPFHIEAIVILPDHLHTIWKLPGEDCDYPTRWRMIKSYFTHRFQPRNKVLEQPLWQRRYWEHCIRDDLDLTRHIEYIHYNPVKHGVAGSPMEWKYSSFEKFVREGLYPDDWGAQGEIQFELGVGFE